MFGRDHGRDRWEHKMTRLQEKMDKVRDRMDRVRGGEWFGPSTSGNRAFDDYREDTLKRLQQPGIVIDNDRNASTDRGVRRISADDSPIVVLVVPTNEELAIARDCVAALAEL